MLPESLKTLIRELSKLPGVGPKSAERIALFIVTSGCGGRLSEAIAASARLVGFCPDCGALSNAGQKCTICANPSRNRKCICVVESPLDVVAFERGGFFGGTYFVLGGSISPIEGITPEDVKIPGLLKMIKKERVEEVIVATNPSAEGDVTASYIAGELAPMSVRVTRIARGLPTGGQVDYADSDTLEKALNNRVEL